MRDETSVFPVRQIAVRIDGKAFHVIEQGQGPAVLFCHGFPDTAATWRSQMQAVARAGYRAIALDMRGYGASYAPSEANLYSAPYIVGDLVGVLDALAIDSAVIVGHDWGAEHGWRAMLMRPDRFRAMVSLSIPFAPRGDRSHWQALREQGLGERYYAFGMMKQAAESEFAPAEVSIPSILYWLSASPRPDERWDPVDAAKHMLRPSPVKVPDWADVDYVDHTIRAFEASGFHGGLNYYRAAQATFDLMPAFKDMVVQQPCLYLYGAADGLADVFHPEPPTMAELRRAAPGLAGVIRLENVGHWIQHEAAERVNAELIGFLASIGAPPARKAHGTSCLPPLMIAAGLGQAQKVQALLAAGADPLAIDPHMGAAALHKAALSGSTDVIALLLDHGAFIDQQSPIVGNTPLMDAVEHRHEEAVRLLLDRGARIGLVNHHGMTALDLVQDDDAAGIARIVDTHREATAGHARTRTLAAAVKAGNLEEVERLVAGGANLDERIPMTGSADDDYTPLGVAARDGHAEIVRLLLDAGADPSLLNGLMQATPAHEAAYAGHAHVLRVLTEHPARAGRQALEIDAQGAYNGYTALHDAIWQGHPDAARALVQAGARLDIKTHAGLTPRQLARRHGHAELARYLAEAEGRARAPI